MLAFSCGRSRTIQTPTRSHLLVRLIFCLDSLAHCACVWPSDGVWREQFDPSQAKTFAVSWLGNIIFNSEIPKQVRLSLSLDFYPPR